MFVNLRFVLHIIIHFNKVFSECVRPSVGVRVGVGRRERGGNDGRAGDARNGSTSDGRRWPGPQGGLQGERPSQN